MKSNSSKLFFRNTNYIIYFFILINFFFLFYKFNSIEPMGDQAFQIYWLAKLLNSKGFFVNNFEGSFYYELLKVMASPNNFFAYYWHSFFIVVLYFFSIIFGTFFIDINQTYIIFSIFISSLNIYLSYLIYRLYIIKITDSQNLDIYSIIIFLLINFSYHKFYYSPLGVHNFAIFLFLLTFYYFQKMLLNNKKDYKNLLFLGMLCSISMVSHQANFLLLLPTIFVSIFLAKDENLILKFKNLFFFMIFPAIFLIPLIFLIYVYYIKTGVDTGKPNISFSWYNFFRIESRNYTLEAIFLWVKHMVLLLGPILLSIIFIFKKKEYINIKNLFIIILVLISFHLFFTFISGFFITSYLRNMLYLNYLIIILFSIIIFINIKSKSNLYLSISIILLSLFYNLFISIDNNNLKKINNYFYESYDFDSTNKISEYHKVLKEKVNFENNKKNFQVLFTNQMSISYTAVYNQEIFNKSINVYRKPLNEIFVIDIKKFPLEMKKDVNYYLYSLLPKKNDFEELVRPALDQRIPVFEELKLNVDESVEKKLFDGFKSQYLSFKDCRITSVANLNQEIRLLTTSYNNRFFKINCHNEN